MSSHKATSSRGGSSAHSFQDSLSSLIRTQSCDSGFSSLPDQNEARESKPPSKALLIGEIFARSTDHESTHPLQVTNHAQDEASNNQLHTHTASPNLFLLKENAQLRKTLAAVLSTGGTRVRENGELRQALEVLLKKNARLKQSLALRDAVIADERKQHNSRQSHLQSQIQESTKTKEAYEQKIAQLQIELQDSVSKTAIVTPSSLPSS